MIVSLIAAVSADGKIAEREDQTSLDWTSKEDTKFFVSKTKELGTVVMGRKTYDTIGRPLKDRRNIVLTRTVSPEPVEGIEFTSESPAVLVDRLKSEGVQGVALIGGSSIYGQFLSAGLVDELFLTIEPVLFGTGVPLATGFERLNLALIHTERLGDHAVLLHYRVRR